MSLVSSVRSASPQVKRLALVNFLMQSANQAAYFVGIIGTATYMLGANAWGVAILVALVNGCYVVGSGTVGIAVDRFGPKAVLTRLLVSYACVTVAALALPLSYTVLVCSAGTMALLTGATSTTINAFPPYLTQGPEELKVANSLVDTAVHAAFIAGPAAGGAISSFASSKAAFCFTALFMACAALVARGMQELLAPPRNAPERHLDPAPSAMGDFLEGIRHTFGSPSLRFLFFVGFWGFFAYGAFDALESLFYRDVLNVGVSWMGWLSMMSGVGSVLGSILLLRIPASRVDAKLLVGMLLLTGLGSMLYVGTDVVGIAAVGQLLCGMGFGLMMPVQHLLVQESCELSHLGRVTGVMRVGLNSSGVLPLVVSPLLAQVVGVQAVLLGASCLVALIAVVFGLSLRRHS